MLASPFFYALLRIQVTAACLNFSSGEIPIYPKMQGRGLMVSDFVDGLLALTDEEYIKAHKVNSRISEYACQIIKYGALGDGS